MNDTTAVEKRPQASRELHGPIKPAGATRR
jgi:hypothetical protein